MLQRKQEDFVNNLTKMSNEFTNFFIKVYCKLNFEEATLKCKHWHVLFYFQKHYVAPLSTTSINNYQGPTM